MTDFIEGEARTQATLFPERLDDYITEQNAVRVIDVFIDSLDLSDLGFKIIPAITGRPAYHPGTMLKLYVYGYLFTLTNNVFADRCVGSVVNGRCIGTMVPGSSSSGYIESSDSSDQYNLSSHYDRQSYGVDIGAQQRDAFSYDRYYDNSFGQFGGGIYDD